MIIFLLILSIFGTVFCTDLEFSRYRSAEQYKCGSFMPDANGRKADVVLTFYYQSIDQFISFLSAPFPHQDLLTKKALTGDLEELQNSVETKYWQWLEWQKGWIIASLSLLAFSVFFVFSYILYKICSCCCSSSSKKQTTDARYDGCKRSLCNLLLFGLIGLNAFVAFTLMMTSQYAQFGLDELPNRMNQCIDDLNVYKRDNDMRIRKLLIEDYQMLNSTINTQLSSAGHNVVDRVKKLTGAHVIDVFLNVSKVAQEMQTDLEYVNDKIRFLNEEGARFEAEFSRLKNTANAELMNCIGEEMEPVKSMCTKAERLLDSLAVTQFKIDPKFISSSTQNALTEIVNANISRVLGESNAQFERLETTIQHEIDKETHFAQNMLKQIGDDLFVVAETISTQLKQVNFEPLYNSVSYVSDPKKTPTMKYIQYSWYVSLVVTGLFVLLAFCFLFGILYGIFGRRPTYYNDDCCVRTTGSKFFSCGIWIFLLLFVFLAFATAIILFVMGNATNLVCQPMRNPLSRPDALSLAERYIEIWKETHKPTNDVEILLEQKTPAEVIRACSRNETLYDMFDFDKKYHLNQLKEFEKESYNQLQVFLKSTMEKMPDIRPLDALISRSELSDLEKLATVNVTKFSQQGLNAIKHAMDELDLISKTREFEESLNVSSGKPKAVSLVLEQINELEAQFAKPLRSRLNALYENITTLDQKLTQLQVPVSSLLVKLQHAQALLSENMKDHFSRGAKEEFENMIANVDKYIEHVKIQMQTEVTSCRPLAEIAKYTTAAVCSYTVDPFNGTWMCMLICLILLVPITVISNSLIGLYSKMHAFPKYIVEPPSESHHMSSFITDTYDTRPKPGYANYTYTDDYQRTYRSRKMGSTVRASHLTATSSSVAEAKGPSVFDILAQENLATSIRPALQHLVKYLAIFKPKTFVTVHRNFDEFYLLFDLMLENYYLKNYGASFTENFYSMKRVHTKTGKSPIDGRERVMSLITLVGWPYVEDKLNKLYDRLKEVYEIRTWASIKDIPSKLKKLFVIIWPYIKSCIKAIKSALQLAYILNRSSIHSPWLYFAGVVLKHLTPEDLESFNSVPLHLKTGFFNRIWRFILGLPGLVSRMFAYGLFFVQFLDYMYNTDLGGAGLKQMAAGIVTPPPPPHRMILKESEVLSLDTNKCPICMKQRVNDTALFVSGYVFCYTCINQYVNTYQKCPVTGCPATSQHLIRLFV
ncbi:unnamed protein product [Caenorhabditis angaria]|uniref:RING-type domain-containing protein n=1 Tax=Caenorhabditis angaria TaxID=860376 RepID=A0A9P1NC54_9PELO|nr:unnamed protein product [Caenorhabditis angaria]